MIAEIFVLAIAAMFWPFLLVVDIVAFRTSRPVAILSWYLFGGLLSTVGLGLAIVYALRSSSLVSGPSKTGTNAAVDLAVGSIAVIAALLIWRRRKREPRKTSDKQSTPSSNRIERLVAKGAALAFAAGIVTNIAPGVFPFIALKDIAELGGSFTATLAVIVGFYLVMFTFIEAPLLAFAFVPARTKVAVGSFNLWLERHGRALAVGALLVFGVLEIAHGIVAVAR